MKEYSKPTCLLDIPIHINSPLTDTQGTLPANSLATVASRKDLWIHLREAFAKFGLEKYCLGNIADAQKYEEFYRSPGHNLSMNLFDDEDDPVEENSADVAGEDSDSSMDEGD